MSAHAIKGFSFTIEAITSLVILIAIISIPVNIQENDSEKIYCIQKQNDLIKAWIKTNNFEETEIKKDFKKMFPFQKGEIIIHGKKIEVPGKQEKNEYKSTGFYYKEGKLQEISVKVFV